MGDVNLYLCWPHLLKCKVHLEYRLTKEYEKLLQDLPKGVNVYLPSETDIYTWEATVEGPEDSLYKGYIVIYIVLVF